MKKSLKVLATLAVAGMAALALPGVGKAEEAEETTIGVRSINLSQDGEGGYIDLRVGSEDIVTYGEDKTKPKTMKATQEDGFDKDGNAVYKIPILAKNIKKQKPINIVINDDKDKAITVEFSTTPGTNVNEVYKATYENDSGEYGKITVKKDNNDCTGPCRLYTKDGLMDVTLKGGTLYSNIEFGASVEAEKHETNWNEILKPVVREGGTVFVASCVETGTAKFNVYESEGIEIDGNKYTVTGKTYTYKYKVGKVKIKAQKVMPAVKVDAVNGKLVIDTKKQYQVRGVTGTDNDGKFTWDKWSSWETPSAKNPLLTSLIPSDQHVSSGLEVRVRIKGTSKAIASTYRTVKIPKAESIEGVTLKSDNGFVTSASITLENGASGVTYEYKKSDATAWKQVKNNLIVKGGKKEAQKLKAGDTYYVRAKGVNEKGTTELKMPSVTIAYKIVENNGIVTVVSDPLSDDTSGTKK